MSVLKKLMEVRIELLKLEIKKTGYNDYSKYQYFELSDFLPTALHLFYKHEMCGVVSFTPDLATLTITDLDDNGVLEITSPMSTASLKACHEVQNLGAVQQYIRRYLWMTALELVEHDAAEDGKEEVVKVEYITVDQATEIQDLCREKGVRLEQFYARFVVDKISMLPAYQYDVAKSMLEERKKTASK